MHIRSGLVMAAIMGLTLGAGRVTLQTPVPGGPPPAGAGPPSPPAPAQGRGAATFPQQQRPPGDPAVIERGKTIYAVICSACHGVDARGGQLGGPNLLRSQLVLADQEGEAIVPVIQSGRPDKGMPPQPVNAADAKAVATFLHSLLAAAGRQGSPPPTDAPPPNVLVGDAASGQTFFAAKCTACHSATGDLQGIASRIPDAKTLQNIWVSGGIAAGRGGRGGRGRGSIAAPVTATVALPSGEKVEGQLRRLDDFIVTLVQADGTERSFRREGDRPKVEIRDPLQGHRDLLAVLTDRNMHDVTAYLVTLK
jgi:cytochrome c oxidase cbb3-type subunit 3